MKVLFIEDEPGMLTGIGLWLRRRGVEVLEAVTLQQALAAIAEHPVALILLDVMMPHGEELGADVDPLETGIAFLRGLRAHRWPVSDPATYQCPVVIITGISHLVETEDLPREGGEVLVFSKPVARRDLEPLFRDFGIVTE
jgi:CheY-like chemotaxis protein